MGRSANQWKWTAYQGHPQSLLTKHDKKGSSLIFNIHGEYIIIRKWNNVRNWYALIMIYLPHFSYLISYLELFRIESWYAGLRCTLLGTFQLGYTYRMKSINNNVKWNSHRNHVFLIFFSFPISKTVIGPNKNNMGPSGQPVLIFEKN